MCINQNWYSTQWGSLLFFLFFDDFFTKNLTFLPDNPVWFYTRNSQKVNISSNFDYNTGNFIDFSPKKVIFSSKCACISSTILTFLQNNPLCFYTKNSQKVNFSSNFDYNTGNFIDFSPKKSDFFLKMCLHIL